MAKILVADDDPNAAQSLGILLDMSGYEVCVVADGVQAVEAASGWQPDAVILDISMPVMNGLQAAGILRARFAELPLIALTGWSERALLEQARHAGFNAVFTKPADFLRLRLALEHLVVECSHGFAPTAPGSLSQLPETAIRRNPRS